MGLDITAYSDLKLIRPKMGDDDGYDEGLRYFYINPDFHGRASEISPNVLYMPAEEFHFKAGSYSGYSEWRRQLAALVGSTPEDFWEKRNTGEFAELINFTDCEGTIGTAVSAKLAKDFAAFEDKAKVHADEWFRQKYQDWKKAFEMAANNGAVSFH